MANPIANAIRNYTRPSTGQPLTTQQAQSQSKYLAQALREIAQGGNAPIQSGGELAARLLATAITARNANKADAALADAQQREKQQQQAILQQRGETLFPGDVRAQTAFIANPEAATNTFWEGYKPTTLSGGQTRYNPLAGDTFTAPELRYEGGIAGTQTADGFQVTGQRPMTYAETETGRHNLVDEGQGWRGLQIQQQNADTGQFSAQTGRLAHEARMAAGGYGTPGVGGVIGPNLDTNEWEVVTSNAPKR